MSRNFTLTRCLMALVLSAVCAGFSQAALADLKLEARLVWGTDDNKPPDGKDYKPVEPELKKKLERPLKWKHYFEVTRKTFTVAHNENKRQVISDKCEIEVKNLDDSSLEVVLFGKGKEVLKRKQALPKGEILILGGDAPNATAWLVILKQAE